MPWFALRVLSAAALTLLWSWAAVAELQDPSAPSNPNSPSGIGAPGDKLEAQAPPKRAFTVRLVAERTYGSWKRDYEGAYLAPGSSANFALRFPETIDAFRGRILFGEARKNEVSAHASFSFELVDEIRHSVRIAGLEHSFASQPMIVGAAANVEVPFLKGGFAGTQLGFSTVNESFTQVSPGLVVTSASMRFALTGELHAGYRFLVHRPLVLGVLGSMEYHLFTNSFRLGLGILLEIDPTR